MQDEEKTIDVGDAEEQEQEIKKSIEDIESGCVSVNIMIDNI